MDFSSLPAIMDAKLAKMLQHVWSVGQRTST